jgi:murein DD-endopeptidase MepM/ murein hydrolase activator NlpD
MSLFALWRPLANGDGEVVQGFGENPALYTPFGLAGHEGLDYAVPIGTPVRAAHQGIAVVENGGPYGLHVVIRNERMMTVYAHLSQVLVPNTAAVGPGDPIALSGNTGRSTGPHLHFGWKVFGIHNPAYQDFIDPVLGRILDNMG